MGRLAAIWGCIEMLASCSQVVMQASRCFGAMWEPGPCLKLARHDAVQAKPGGAQLHKFT